MTPTALFHPAVAAWFDAASGAHGGAGRGWPAIQAGRHTLIAAPTGSGKTLAAFLAAIDALVRAGPRRRAARTRRRSSTSRRSRRCRTTSSATCEAPLAGIRAELRGARAARGRDPHAGAHRRHAAGRARRACASAPPHILVTTPESLYILLGARVGRAMLRDRAHRDRRRDPRARADKRGAHLALSLERLAALARRAACCASASRRRRSRSRRSRASWSGPAPTARRRGLHDRRRRPPPRARPRARGARRRRSRR